MSDTFAVEMDRLEGFRFRVDFGAPEIAELVVDEPPPLGAGTGPNPARLLATAVGNCLSASLVFCLSRARYELGGVRTEVLGHYARNERGRLRIGGLEVTIHLDVPASERPNLEKCLGMFEDFCVVTASVRKGLSVGVKVLDRDGGTLFESAGEPVEGGS